MLLLLLLVAVDQQGGAEHHHAHAAEVAQAVLGELLVQHELLSDAEACATDILRPRRGDPALVDQRLAPLLVALAPSTAAGVVAVLVDELPHLGAERRLGWAVPEIHGRSPS